MFSGVDVSSVIISRSLVDLFKSSIANSIKLYLFMEILDPINPGSVIVTPKWGQNIVATLFNRSRSTFLN